MLPVLLNVAYALALLAASPWLVYRRWVQRKPVAGLWQKLTGRIERRHPERPCVWFHAVSVGEVLQLQHLVAEFCARYPEHEVLITTSTGTGYDVARQKFPQHTIAFWPFDFTWSVARALQTVSPSLVVLIELELWPNFLLGAQHRGVQVALLNGRISEKSYRGYRRLMWLWQHVLPCVARAAMQTDEYARRLMNLGMPAERIAVTGNIKYDRVESNRHNPKTEELRRAFGIGSDEIVFIAGSTQEPEEEFALAAWEAVRDEFPSLRLIIVPRHKERFDAVAALIESRRLPCLRRSKVTDSAAFLQRPVLLLDTLGELAACWGLADLAFVGGSLTSRGGQNMLEPAGYGAAVLFGPNTWNFQDIVERLISRDAAIIVRNADDLRETVRLLVNDPGERQRLGTSARDFVLTQQGATTKMLDLVEAVLQTRQFIGAIRSAA